MRKLLVTRGPQGAGKSTTLRQLGLGGHILNPDSIRRILASPVMNPQGFITTPQEHDRRVWGMVKSILTERMSRGELLAVDATHRAAGDFRLYLTLARRYRYTIGVLDFSTIPLALALARNRDRPDFEIVPEDALRRTHQACQDGQIPEGVHHILWQEGGGHLDAVRSWLAEPVLDGDAYTAVYLIGDLQGCLYPLRRFFDAYPFRDDALYLFVGDLCDRGTENGDLLRYLMPLIEKPNVRVHWGNHEDYLNDWSQGEEILNEEFTERTAPQLLAAGITPEDADALCQRLVDFTVYRRAGVSVMVNHAGLSNVPAHPERISLRQYALGTGYYNDPVDERFDRLAPEGWVQVHGHRNPDNRPPQASARSYNLEGQVEHGGQLRVLIHDARGFTPVSIDNPVYRDYQIRQRLGSLRAEEAHRMPSWLQEMPLIPTMPAPELAAMREHPLIREKPLESRPWISSFNFTRDAFYQRSWDALNVTARGLFINNETDEIAARSYDKFFNLGEREETRPENLREHLQFPVTVYRKDNGFLGILGYDSRPGTLMFCSKTSIDSDFAGWFEDIFDTRVPPGKKELLRRYLRDTQSAMAFEVIDPNNDPHIIAYDAPRLVLLDVIRRHPTFARLEYRALQSVGKRFGLEVKGRAMTFQAWEGLWGWLRQARAPDYQFSGEWVEGFVMEDCAGFQFKLKCDYYNFWKSMRGLKDRILALRGTDRPLGRDIREPRVQAFYDWAVQLSDEALSKDIVTLRELFLAGADVPTYTPPRSAQPSPAAIGFQRALENLAQEAQIKRKTADGLLRAALENNDKLAVLRASPIRDRLVLAATPGQTQMDAAEAVNMDLDAPEPMEE